MRFISKAQAFKRAAIKAKRTLVKGADGTPEYVETKRGYIAQFSQGGATNNEVQQALARFQFKGLGERENPARRISIFDTDEVAHREGWTPEFKAEVEEGLLAGQGEFYFLSEQPKLEKPWPSYDLCEVEDVVPTAELVGVDLAHVLAYERENLNRAEVIAAIEGDPEPAEVEIEA